MTPQREDTDGVSRVYLDHAATAPLRPEVWRAMEEARGKADFNPSSAHRAGQGALRHLEEARSGLADVLGAEKRRIFFTGGGTQSNNLAVLGFRRAHAGDRPRILVSAVEHKAVLGAAERAAAEGAVVDRVPVDSEGTVDLEALEELLAGGVEEPCLVSLMWANNEVGTVQPVARAAELAHERGALFHTDAVQAVGKRDVSVGDVEADLLTVTAHKLGGPVGIGLLYVREGVELEPITHGGSQEKGLWPGTQNPMAATGFAEAARLAAGEAEETVPRWRALRDELADRLRSELADLRVHAGGAPERLPSLLSVGIPGCDSAELTLGLDLEGVAISSGSACSSGSSKLSHVLGAMGVEAEEGPYAVARYSFGPETTAGEVERAADATIRVALRLRSRSVAGARESAAR